MRDSTNITRTYMKYALAALIGLFWAFGTEYSNAQRFEWVYGGDRCDEDGQFRVIPVTGGCGQNGDCAGGYIAVGTSFSVSDDCETSDVYVVRFDNCGRAYWEKTYDISGANLDDVGYSIIEVDREDGFILTGYTTSDAGDLDAFLMEIDCMGVPQWTATYGNSDGSEVGRDLIEAQTGNADLDIRPGDIVVAGRTDVSGTLDGYLFRARRAGGALVWDATYDTDDAVLEWFNSLTEAASSGIQGTTTGDIVAVGGRDPDRIQGYIVRVSCDNGSITTGATSAQNVAEYGIDAYDDEFFSVIELQNPAETGSNLGFPNVVVAGYGTTVDAAGSVGIDNFVVKLEDGDPCTPMTQRMIGDGGGSIVDRARTIRELPAALGQNSQYDLIMTGVTDYQGNDDAYLLSLNPNLTPSGNVTQTYGGDQVDEGWSTYPVYRDNIGHLDGFVVCGLTQSDLAGANDPQDMYLIRTDTRGSSGCEQSYRVRYVDAEPYSCIGEVIGRIDVYSERNTEDIDRDWGDEVCACQTPKLNPLPGEEFSGSLTEIAILPNPASNGELLTLTLKATVSRSVTLTATNSLGEKILSKNLSVSEGKNELTIKTAGWPSGVYHITIQDGEYNTTTHMVITD